MKTIQNTLKIERKNLRCLKKKLRVPQTGHFFLPYDNEFSINI